MKEEREALTQEGVKSQEKLESLLKELAEDKKSLEKAEQESNDLDTEISEKDRQAGKAFKFSFDNGSMRTLTEEMSFPLSG